MIIETLHSDNIHILPTITMTLDLWIYGYKCIDFSFWKRTYSFQWAHIN